MSESNVPLLELKPQIIEEDDANGSSLSTRIWVESKQLWHIVGPAIFSRVASYSMLVITQAFAGHLGDLELAAMSIANNVIVGFDFGLLVISQNTFSAFHDVLVFFFFSCIFSLFVFQLGMASALETLCGQAYGAKKFHMLGIYMQRSWIVLFICSILILPIYLFSTPVLKLLGQPSDLAEMAGKVAMVFLPLHFSFAIQFPLQRFLQSQLKTAVIAYLSLVALVVHILVSWLFVYGLKLGLVGTAITTNISWWVLVFGLLFYTICGGCPGTWCGFSFEAFSGLWEFVKLSTASGVMIWLIFTLFFLFF